MTPHNEQGRYWILAWIAAIVSAAAVVGCQSYQRPDGSTGYRVDEQRVAAARDTAGVVGTAVAGAAETVGVATGQPWLTDAAGAITGLLALLGVGAGSAAIAHGRGSRTGWNEARAEAGLPVAVPGMALATLSKS